MIRITTPDEMTAIAKRWRRQGKKIGLVPTMGCLHEGHLSLVRKGCELADKVVTSIFVNPMQFGPNEDLDAYPRQLQEDCRLLEAEGVDCVFCPTDDVMYRQNFQTMVRVQRLSLGMCGADRPGHFDGVATVVSKLFNIVQPDVAMFGQKDYQQLALIKQLVEDLNFPVEIIGCPIVREADGLAMSSRNKYLKPEDRQAALSLSRSIKASQELVAKATSPVPAAQVLRLVEEIVLKSGAQLEYGVVVDGRSLEKVETVVPGTMLAVAAKIRNRVRLIDNGQLC